MGKPRHCRYDSERSTGLPAEQELQRKRKRVEELRRSARLRKSKHLHHESQHTGEGDVEVATQALEGCPTKGGKRKGNAQVMAAIHPELTPE